MSVKIIPFTIEFYDKVYGLWSGCDGVGLSNADSRENVEKYLLRNPGMSSIAVVDGRVVGAVLAGHDGRRGYIHHLAVSDGYRRNGIGRMLVEECLLQCKKNDLAKCHIFIFRDNSAGESFWKSIGWTLRDDLHIVSKTLA